MLLGSDSQRLRSKGVARWLGLLSLLHCSSPEYEVLTTRVFDSGGVGGTVRATSAAGGEPLGGSGTEPFSSHAGAGGSGTACVGHSNCEFGQLCFHGRCEPCGPANCSDPCPFAAPRVELLRNGCVTCECEPRSECSQDIDCPGGQVCYIGLQCEEGCAGLSCCLGNQCSVPGCASPAAVDCALVGCADGQICSRLCPPPVCECDSQQWVCAASGGGQDITCASSCLPP